jgi:hypothetical protein
MGGGGEWLLLGKVPAVANKAVSGATKPAVAGVDPVANRAQMKI